MDPSAETAYVFRHALLRDAAYQLQIPSARARLHSLAFALIEDAFGGRAPRPSLREGDSNPKISPHSTDLVIDELVHHAWMSAKFASKPLTDFVGVLELYLLRGALLAESQGNKRSSMQRWLKLAEIVSGVEKCESLINAALAAHTLGPIQLSDELLQRAEAAMAPNAPVATRFRLVSAKGHVLMHHGAIRRAETCFREGLHLARGASNQRLETVALLNMAGASWRTGRNSTAEKHFRTAIGLCEALGSQRIVVVAKANFGAMLQGMGRFPEAEQFLCEALAGSQAIGNLQLQGAVLGNLGLLNLERARYDFARHFLMNALPAHQEAGDQSNLAVTLSNLGLLAEAQDQPDHAEAHFLRAFSIYTELGDRRGQGVVLSELASLYLNLGETQRAIELALEALRLHELVSNKPWIANTLGNLARMWHLNRQMQESRETYIRAIALARECSSPIAEGGHLCGYALLLLDEGNVPEARQTWLNGFQILQDANALNQLKSSLGVMRRVCARAGVPPFDESCENTTSTGESSA